MSEHRIYFWNSKQVCERCFEELEALADYQHRPMSKPAVGIIAVALAGLIWLSAILCVDCCAKYIQSAELKSTQGVGDKP